jgi:alkanesulfonate monooxygenase SsuD/methylene tetrahydromethanopterin reductase-like flavin-dependent oxidoreductase (luciferase family)
MDHFYQLPTLGAPTQFMTECYSLLSALAHETWSVRLGALVTGNTYRNPAVLAKTVTTLDVVSNGRAQLGIGAGWFELEHDAWQRSTCIALTMEEAQRDLVDGFRDRGVDLASLDDGQRKAITDRFIVGDPDTVGEQLAADLELGIDGFTLNAVLNGHVPGSVALLGQTAAKAVPPATIKP